MTQRQKIVKGPVVAGVLALGLYLGFLLRRFTLTRERSQPYSADQTAMPLATWRFEAGFAKHSDNGDHSDERDIAEANPGVQ